MIKAVAFFIGVWSVSVAASTQKNVEVPKDLRRAAYTFHSRVSGEFLTLENCSTYLHHLYEALYTLPPDYFDISSLLHANGDLWQARAEIVYTSFFRSRLALRNKLRQFVVNGADIHSPEFKSCVNHIRVALRTARTYEDYWGSWALRRLGYLGWRPEAMAGGRPYLLMNINYRSPKQSVDQFDWASDLKSGDIFLTRGTSFTSAVISRIGAVDNQFSHLALVYRDQSGLFADVDPEHFFDKVYIVEAVIDEGLRWLPFEKFTKDKARLALFRYRHLDESISLPAQDLMERAAYILAKRAKAGETGYNFPMDMSITEDLFCSQAVAIGLEQACKELEQERGEKACDETPFPLMQTEFHEDHPLLARLLGITVTETFAPSDVEIDPRLDLVFEWRDFSKMDQLRSHDMVMTKLFQWMELLGYQFAEGGLARTDFHQGTSFFHWLATNVLNKMPANTPEGFVSATALLGYLVEYRGTGLFTGGLVSSEGDVLGAVSNQVGLKLLLQRYQQRLLTGTDASLLEIFGEEAVKQRSQMGLGLTDFEMDRFLESYRILDCRHFREDKESRLHLLLRESFGETEEPCSLEPIQWFDLR